MPTVNPRTGLRESHNDFFNVPMVHQRSIGALRFGGQMTAVHTAPLHDGLTLDFYASLRRSDELVISLVGANSAHANFYPRFQRVKTLRKKAPAFICLADPTLQLDPERKILLAWYLGGPGWDPADAVIRTVQKAVGKCGARHIAFIGGSGGGFAALRLSTFFPGSMAFVNDPQTNIAKYSPRVVSDYFSTVWPGWDQDKLLEAFPERFDMVRHYRNRPIDNFVYYTQNRHDQRHYSRHYEPFRQAVGIKEKSGSSRDGSRHLVLYSGESQSHGGITAAEYDRFYADAFQRWRAHRGDA